jgi:hypothetical protein
VKKLAIGCSLVVLVLAVAGMAATYWVYRKVSTTVSEFAALADVPRLEREIRNTAAFSPPSSGELTQEQVQRLVRVQATVRQRLGQRFAEMQKRYETLFSDRRPDALDAPALVAAYRDLAHAWMDAKRAQVEALNQARFSLEEYRWVREQVYAAVGVPILNLDVAKLIEDVTAGVTDGDVPARVAGAFGPSGPGRNRELVAEFKKALEDNAALAAFGL